MMKRLFSRYSHWLFLIILLVSIGQTLIDFEGTKLDFSAVIMGLIGFLSLGYLIFQMENQKKKQK